MNHCFKWDAPVAGMPICWRQHLFATVESLQITEDDLPEVTDGMQPGWTLG